MTTEPIPDDAAAHASERDPREYPYGIYVADGQIAIHMWFTDATAALRIYVLSDLLHYILGEEDTECRVAVKEVLDRALAAGQTIAEVADELNRITGDESQLLWYGTFDSLVSGDSEHAREMRSGFRDDDGTLDDEALEAPLTKEQIGEFVEFVQRYGY